jgi:RNA polymerase sigma factor (sigma-70 family)
MKEADFMQMITPFQNKMFRLVRRLLISVDSTEDACQEVLLKLWNMRTKLGSYRSVEALAMTMAKNHCLDVLKSKQAQELRIVHSNFDNRETSIGRQIEMKESVGIVGSIINKLPEKQRLVIQLKDIEQYDFEEIEEVLGMSYSAIRTNLSRARQYVKEELIKIQNYGLQKS